MSWWYRRLARPALFTQDPEEVHDRTLTALGWLGRHEVLCDALEAFFGAPELPVDLLGLRFPNPLGLAAGMDKHATAVPAWSALGFGYVELGGVTWHAQPGNSTPRMFRAVTDEAVINRMGFNNPGAEAVAANLAEWRALGRWPRHPVGINLGKSKITPLEKAAEDYANSLRALWPHADFFVINVSSPNTPNLRQLQDKAALDEILASVQQVNELKSREWVAESHHIESPFAVIGQRPQPKPLLVKIAPDLSFEALDEILELVEPRRIAGIVATNTTITRPDTNDVTLRRVYEEAGGLSGRPLRARSTQIVRHLFRQTRGALPIIGVGGIFTADDAWEKIAAGASLLQVYTGMVFEGPGLVKTLVTALRLRLAETGLKSLAEAVGRET
jgi:dihydroorotate dehydrogenase